MIGGVQRGIIVLRISQLNPPPTPTPSTLEAHFNAFVPPASVDWMAHEWQPSNFVRHFAGCPWQEQPCLQMMMDPWMNISPINAAMHTQMVKKMEKEAENAI